MVPHVGGTTKVTYWHGTTGTVHAPLVDTWYVVAFDIFSGFFLFVGGR